MKNGKRNFDAMAKKTVLKLLIGKWGMVSNDLQQAVRYDQAVVDKEFVTYVDNDGRTVEREDYSQLDSQFENIDPETGEILTVDEAV